MMDHSLRQNTSLMVSSPDCLDSLLPVFCQSHASGRHVADRLRPLSDLALSSYVYTPLTAIKIQNCTLIFVLDD